MRTLSQGRYRRLFARFSAALFHALDRLDANPRVVYATTGLTIDMVFSASYALLVATLLLRLIRGGAPLYLPPLASALADVLENTTFRGEDRVVCFRRV